MNNIQKLVVEKQQRLVGIVNSLDPVVELLFATNRQRIKIARARSYLKELAEFTHLGCLDTKVRVVSNSGMEKLVSEADYSIVEYDGDYCKVILTKTFPEKEEYLIYMAPLSVL